MPLFEARLPAVPVPLPADWGQRGSASPAWRREAGRMAIGSAGPVAVAGMQFAASMLLWANVSAQAFGLFAFVLLLIQLSFGLSNALVGTPLSVAPGGDDAAAHRDACLSAHGLLLAAVAIVIPATLIAAGARWSVVAFAAWAVSANLRWAARSYAIAGERIASSASSDGIYAICGAALLALTAVTHAVSLTSMALALMAANAVALLCLSRDFLRLQFAALHAAAFRRYRTRVWPLQAGWSVVGVVSTEAASNAHAYLVTYLCGAPFFAPLAFGALFCRPLTIFLTALNQIDRPLFARHLRSGAGDRVQSLMRNNFAAVSLVWFGNAMVALVALWWFAPKIAARGYDVGDIRVILLLWFAIMALRAARNPLSTFLQASGRFRPLAHCSLYASIVSIAAVALIARASPTWSLAGILGGEALFLGLVAQAYRRRGA